MEIHDNTLEKKYFNKKEKLSEFYKIIIVLLLICLIIKRNNISYKNDITIDKQFAYNEKSFAILTCKQCKNYGLFAHFKHYLPCTVEYINKGYIPIIDLESIPNIFNNHNNITLNFNPWEIYFNQPFGFYLDEVKKNAKKIEYFNCDFPHTKMNHKKFYSSLYLVDFWHENYLKYIPIKNEFIKQAEIISEKLFHGSKNILGILMRGTDYIARKPNLHPKVPKVAQVVADLNLMEEKNHYQYYFIATEDDNIREQFIKIYGEKLKYVKTAKIEYSFEKKEFLMNMQTLEEKIEVQKAYLINMIILSKCIDIIAARTNGTMGVFILTNGFRNKKIYFIGRYSNVIKNKK